MNMLEVVSARISLTQNPANELWCKKRKRGILAAN